MRDGTRRGTSRSNVVRRDRGDEGRTGHARNAAEEQEPEVYTRNRRDGTWRRSGGMPQPGQVSLTQYGLWRPWVAQEETEESLQTIVSIVDPENYHQRQYFASTDIRERRKEGKLII